MDIIITVQVQGGANLKIPFDDTLEQVGFWWPKVFTCVQNKVA
jgi:hypothetical protein